MDSAALVQSGMHVLTPVAVLVGAVLTGALVELVVLRRLAALARRTAWRGDDVIMSALRFKPVLWSVLLGINLALPYLPNRWKLSPDGQLVIQRILLVVLVLSLTLLVAQISTGLINAAARDETRPALSIVTNIVRGVVYIVGALFVLQIFEIQITPALAALGVGGLAVSLALQATLTDLVSGLQVIVARQIRPGDYIQLSGGEAGYVTDISWRTTTIHQLSNNLVIIPNAKMTSSIVTNFSAPEKDLSIPLEIGVGYESDLERVERVTLEVAREVMASVEGSVPGFEPILRFTDFADSSVRFKVTLRAREFADQYLIKHEFIKRLHQRYRAEGIEIPFPMRTVHLRGEHGRDLTLAALREYGPGEAG